MAGWMMAYEGVAWESCATGELRDQALVDAIDQDAGIEKLRARAKIQGWEILVHYGFQSDQVVVVLGIDRLPSKFVSDGEIEVVPSLNEPLPQPDNALIAQITGVLALFEEFSAPEKGLVFIGFT